VDAPGPFFFLVRDGVVPLELLAPLLERLPAEKYVRTSVRDGEGFDSQRWPVARDAALARVLAQRFDEPEIARAIVEVEAAAGDAPRLRALMRRAGARWGAAAGGEPSMFVQWWRDATADDLAVFSEPPWSSRAAWVVMNLCSAYHAAADGLYAFHVHRGIPGTGAEVVVQLAKQALADGRIDVAGLVAAAEAVVAAGEPYFAVAPSPAARPVIEAIADACAEVRRATGASRCTVMSEAFAVPSLPDGSKFMISAGPRALVLLDFTSAPAWTSRVASFRSRPLFTRAGRPARFELVLGPEVREEDRAPAAVAALCFFVEVTLEAHIAAHPEDEAVFPSVDDAMLGRLFG
jgi:hypothetical protein